MLFNITDSIPSPAWFVKRESVNAHNRLDLKDFSHTAKYRRRA